MVENKNNKKENKEKAKSTPKARAKAKVVSKAKPIKKEVVKEEVIEIKGRFVQGKFYVTIGKEVIQKKPDDADHKQVIIDAIDKAKIKPSPVNIQKLRILLKPKEDEKKKEDIKKKYEAEVELETTKKALKNQAKKELTEQESLAKLIKNKTLVKINGKFYLPEFPTVHMPDMLVKRIGEVTMAGQDITPYINFWVLCLANPNKIARYKLFNYLMLHNMLITPAGYFVTYRMVKDTEPDTSHTLPKGTYTHAHDGKPRLYYKVGEVAKLDRKKDCDEDGGKDCSKGIHFGSPKFIGIEVKEEKGLGEGYDMGVKKVMVDSNAGYGTGYDSSSSKKVEQTQKFNNSFGNVATIWLVNPMHVVSVPNSDTRKMRACEGYFCKTTTVEEVISHLTTKDYFVFDNAYRAIEIESIKRELAYSNLESYTDGTLEEQTEKAKGTKKVELLKKLESNEKLIKKLTFGDDSINNELTAVEIVNLVRSRTVQITKPKKK